MQYIATSSGKVWQDILADEDLGSRGFQGATKISTPKGASAYRRILCTGYIGSMNRNFYRLSQNWIWILQADLAGCQAKS